MALFESAVQQARRYYDEFKKKQLPAVSSAVNQTAQNVGNFVKPIVNVAAKQPLLNTPTFGLNMPTQKPIIGPTIGQYAQQRVVQPIQQGVKQIQQPGLQNKVGGALHIASGGFSAVPTPVSALYNIGLPAVSGAIQAIRTRQPILSTVNKSILNPSSTLATTGLGIGNKPINVGGINVAPGLAMGIDLAAGNPKSLLKGATGITTALRGYSPRSFNIHPEDQKIMQDFVISVQNGGAKRALGQLGKDAQSIAEHYIGSKAKGISNEKLAKAFDAMLSSAARSRGEDALQTQFPRMGLIGKNQESNSLKAGEQQISQLSQKSLGRTTPTSLSVEQALVGNPPGSSSSKSIAQIPNSKNPYFNTNRINVKPEAKQLINKTLQEVKPSIERVVGKKLSNNEIIATANNSAKVLRRVVDRQQTSDFETALLKTRQKLAAMSESGTVDKDYLDTLITLKSHATDIGRKLQSFNIKADPKNITAKNAIMEAVTKVEGDSNKILEAAKGVDFNDFNQATEFYRKFIKPTKTEWADTLRYNSMLSSPNTHINNAFSNALNSGIVAPIEKTITGGLDFLKSTITGKDRQAFAGEGAAYAKGYAQNLGEASHKFIDSLRGNKLSGNLDARMIPLAQKGIRGGIEKALTAPTKLLEASDQFFTTLTAGGERAALQLRKSKGINVGNIETQAANNAAYRLFRSELGDEKQGHLLDAIDKFTGIVQQARTSDNAILSNIAKFTLPFVRTPMNILKQGIEYSPAGVLTLPGAANKTEQVSKVLIGSSAVTATALLASSGRTTWAEPTDETAKQTFRAAGMQPYSVKIGDKWVSYSKLPPAMSFNIALVSAIHDAQDKKQLDDNQVETILDGVAKWGNFFADQSYLKNIGDFVAAAKGDKLAVSQAISNYPQQIVPFRAMLGWIARTLDPYQRRVDPGEDFIHKQVDLLKTQIPGLSQQVTPRLDERGNPIQNSNRFINAISPAKITTENLQGKARYDMRNTELQANAYIKPLKQEIDTQVGSIADPLTTKLFNQLTAGQDISEDMKQEIYKKISERVNSKVKSAVMRKRAQDINKLIQNIPGKTPQERKTYLLKLKSSGLLNEDVVQALSVQQ